MSHWEKKLYSYLHTKGLCSLLGMFYFTVTDTFRKYKEKITSQVPATVEAKVSIWFIRPS